MDLDYNVSSAKCCQGEVILTCSRLLECLHGVYGLFRCQVGLSGCGSVPFKKISFCCLKVEMLKD